MTCFYTKCYNYLVEVLNETFVEVAVFIIQFSRCLLLVNLRSFLLIVTEIRMNLRYANSETSVLYRRIGDHWQDMKYIFDN